MRTTKTTALSLLALMIASASLSACGAIEKSGIKTEARYPTGANRDGTDANNIYGEAPSIFGDGGISFGSKQSKDSEESGITVNSYLWRASLDTVSFMPLASADPFGGVILTDWHMSEENPTERFKLNVFILSKQLKSNGIQVRVFKQALQNGTWKDVAPSKDMAIQLEDSILTRARQLRVAQMDK